MFCMKIRLVSDSVIFLPPQGFSFLRLSLEYFRKRHCSFSPYSLGLMPICIIQILSSVLCSFSSLLHKFSVTGISRIRLFRMDSFDSEAQFTCNKLSFYVVMQNCVLCYIIPLCPFMDFAVSELFAYE